MIKSRFKRVIASLLVVVMLASTLTACKRDVATTVKPTNVFRSETLEMPEKFDYIEQILFANGKIFLYGYSSETYDTMMVRMDADGSNPKRIEFDILKKPEVEEATDIAIAEDTAGIAVDDMAGMARDIASSNVIIAETEAVENVVAEEKPEPLTAAAVPGDVGMAIMEAKVDELIENEAVAAVDNTANVVKTATAAKAVVETFAVVTEVMPTLPAETVAGSEEDIPVVETNTNLYQFTIAKDGTIWGVANTWTYNRETGDSTELYEVVHFDENGNTLERFDIKDIVKPENENEYIYLNTLTALPDGGIAANYNTFIYIISPEGELKSTIEIESDYIEKMLTDSKGNLIVFYYDTTEYRLHVKKVNPTTGEMEGDYELDDLAKNNAYTMTASTDPNSVYELYYRHGTSIYGFDAEAKASTELINLINSDINANYIQSLSVVDDNTAFCYFNSYMGDNSAELLRLTRIPDEEVVEKAVLTLGCTYLDSSVMQYVITFNRANETTRIVVEDYSKYNTENDYDAARTKLQNDIISGRIPDILILSTDMPYETYAARGMFLDLYTMLDTDTELKRTDFLENVLRAMEINEKLVMISPSFEIQTLVAKTKFVGENGLNMAEFREMIDRVKAENEDMMVFQDVTQSQLLQYAFSLASEEFIDPDTGKCYFDTPGFIEVLKFAKELDPKSFWESEDFNYDELDEEFWNNRDTAFRDDRVLFAMGYLSSYSDYWRMLKGQFNDEITLVGFPCESRNGSALSMSNYFAISSRTKLKDEAWKFVKQFISKDYQMSLTYEFPILKEALAEVARQDSTPPKLNEHGYVEYVDGQRNPSTWYYLPDGRVEIGVITEDYVKVVDEFIGKVDMLMRYNDSVMKIIEEEAGAFFAGQKSAEDVAALIQNRVSIFVSESR